MACIAIHMLSEILNFQSQARQTIYLVTLSRSFDIWWCYANGIMVNSTNGIIFFPILGQLLFGKSQIQHLQRSANWYNPQFRPNLLLCLELKKSGRCWLIFQILSGIWSVLVLKSCKNKWKNLLCKNLWGDCEFVQVCLVLGMRKIVLRAYVMSCLFRGVILLF